MSIILRNIKGSELTFTEVDGNFSSLFYSSSLDGNTLKLHYYPNTSQSIDLSSLSPNAFSGSLLITASAADNTVTFTKGDGSTFPVIVQTGSIANTLTTASISSNVITFTKADGDQFAITVNTGSVSGDIFAQTGSYYATTNDLQISGSLTVTGSSITFDTKNASYGSTRFSGSVRFRDDVIVGDDLDVKDETTLDKQVAIGYRGNENLFNGYTLSVSQSTDKGAVLVEGAAFISGSLTITGSNTIIGNITASNNISSSGYISASSFNAAPNTINELTASYAITSSHALNTSTYDYLAIGTIPSATVNAPPMGTGYSSALGVATTGGSGTGMTVDTVVEGGGVLTVTINNPGTGYVIGDNNIVISGGNGAAIITLSGTISETNPSLRLIDNTFTFDDVKLTGGTNVTITRTSDTGITFDAASTATPGGLTTQIQFNDAGSFNGDPRLIFKKSTGLIQLSGSLEITGSSDSNSFLIKSASLETFKINDKGVAVFGDLPYTPSAIEGGLIFSGSNFWVGL